MSNDVEGAKPDNDFPTLIRRRRYLPTEPPVPTLTLVSHDDLMALNEAKKSREPEQRAGIERILAHLAANRVRPLATWSNEAITKLEGLRESFPNFIPVIDHITAQAYLAKLGNGVFSLNPLLLEGVPGIGKTQFVSELADIVGTNSTIIDMAQAQIACGIDGGSKHWANADTGTIAETLIFGEHANQIVILDELDKTADVERYNPLKPLLGLLEKRSASEFKDNCVPELRLNASAICFIALANDPELISGPILSRFTRFKISDPDEIQCRAITKSIYSKILSANSWGSAFPTSIAEDVIDELVKIGNPREIRKAIESSFGKAAMAGRKEVLVQDIEMPFGTVTKKRKAGFL